MLPLSLVSLHRETQHELSPISYHQTGFNPNENCYLWSLCGVPWPVLDRQAQTHAKQGETCVRAHHWPHV